MFSFLQNVFSRGVRAASELESNDVFDAEAVSLRGSAGVVSDGYSLSQLKIVNGDERSSDGNSVPVSLRAVVAALPKNLKDAVQGSPDPQMYANIPLPLIAAQLPRGSVRITFAELRNFSPKGVLSSSPAFDNKRITLPLQEILVSIQVAPSKSRKKLEMPDDIPDLFTYDGRTVGLPNSRTNGDEVTSTVSVLEQVEAREVEPEHRIPDLAESPADAERQSLEEPRMALLDNTNSEAPTNTNDFNLEKTYSNSDDVESAARVAEDVQNSELETTDGIRFSLSDLQDGEKREGEAVPASDSDSDTGVSQTRLSADVGSLSNQHIEVSLEAIVDVLPNEIKEEVSQAGVETIIEIPLMEIAPKTSCGRIEFPWSALHGWIKPALPPTRHGEIKVNLPLKEIVPLFLAEYRPAVVGKRKVIAEDEIPDVFRRGNGTPFHVVNESEFESDGSVQIEDPRSLLEAVASLHGVEGAIFVSHDGLVVAERIPDHVDGVALAAFLPEMVGRTTDYLSKAHLGVPDWMVLQIEGRMLQISKAGNLYVAVLGETGRPLPRTKLREILNRISVANPAS